MIFSLISFLCVFLPIVFILYYLMPNIRAKNFLLIFASFLFYSVGEPIYVLILFGSTVMNYLFGRLIASFSTRSKIWAGTGIAFNIILLGVFKYLDFVIDSFNSIFHAGIPITHLVLPIGISFYTFQAISYIIDVYRKPSIVQKNYFHVVIYISMFPQIIAGPIVKYHDISDQILNRTHNIDNIVIGIKRFVIGLSKKILIANVLGDVANQIFALDTGDVNIMVAWLGGLTYTLQIYYDFSGYSDMAIGLAKMFGFDFKENFQYPYGALGIKDFWSKWHISLSSWFKEYLYIPLGGNRKGPIRTIVNKYIVFFITGLWHGANWTFIIWGLLHGTLLVLEDSKKISIRQLKNRGIIHIYTWVAIITTFVLFRASTLEQGLLFIKEMYTGFFINQETLTTFFMGFTPMFIVVLFISLIFIFPVKEVANKWFAKSKLITGILPNLVYVVIIVLLLLNIINLSSSTYVPFIYLKF